MGFKRGLDPWRKLKGYLTPSGWFGEMPSGKWELFPTEEDWIKKVKEEREG